MPVARYFLFVGGVLLALLFLSDAYAPTTPVVSATQAGVDKSVIRIHSDRKWPERIVFDTNLPTIVPAQIVATQTAPQVPANAARAAVAPVVADVAAQGRTLQAFAQLKPAEPRKPDLKPQRKRKIARAHISPLMAAHNSPPMMLVAQQPRFGFFDSNW